MYVGWNLGKLPYLCAFCASCRTKCTQVWWKMSILDVSLYVENKPGKYPHLQATEEPEEHIPISFPCDKKTWMASASTLIICRTRKTSKCALIICTWKISLLKKINCRYLLCKIMFSISSVWKNWVFKKSYSWITKAKEIPQIWLNSTRFIIILELWKHNFMKFLFDYKK